MRPTCLATRPALLLATLLPLAALAGCALCRVAPAPTQAFPPQIAKSALQKHVEVLAAAPRPPGPALEAAEEYLAAELEAAGIPFTRQPVVGPHDNLIVRFGPSPYVVVGAHYDSHEDTPGADDNASGVAVLLEVTKALRTTAPTKGVEIVFYTHEEPPFFRTEEMGSYVHAKNAKDIVGMVSIEMVGYYDDTPGTQTFPNFLISMAYPDTGNFLAVVGTSKDAEFAAPILANMGVDDRLRVYSALVPPSIRGVDFSDHLNYWARDIRAVMLTDTAFLRNERYHEPSDTPDTLDYARMALVADGVLRWLTVR